MVHAPRHVGIHLKSAVYSSSVSTRARCRTSCVGDRPVANQPAGQAEYEEGKIVNHENHQNVARGAYGGRLQSGVLVACAPAAVFEAPPLIQAHSLYQRCGSTHSLQEYTLLELWSSPQAQLQSSVAQIEARARWVGKMTHAATSRRHDSLAWFCSCQPHASIAQSWCRSTHLSQLPSQG